jgi:hypothetical protein
MSTEDRLPIRPADETGRVVELGDVRSGVRRGSQRIAIESITAYSKGFELRVSVSSIIAEPQVISVTLSHEGSAAEAISLPSLNPRASVVRVSAARSEDRFRFDFELIPLGNLSSPLRVDAFFWVEPLPLDAPLQLIIETMSTSERFSLPAAEIRSAGQRPEYFGN